MRAVILLSFFAASLVPLSANAQDLGSRLKDVAKKLEAEKQTAEAEKQAAERKRQQEAQKKLDEVLAQQRELQKQLSKVATPAPNNSVPSNDVTMPSVMAKDYWTTNNPTWVLDSSGNTVSSFTFGIPVTTYGERDGLGKVDLTKDKWVKLSDLSTSKPIARTVTSNAAITGQPVKTMPSTPSYISAKKLHVPSDPNANYYLLESIPVGNNLSIVTRRLGPSGESFSKREIDCKNTRFRYLGDGNSIEEMNAPYDVKSMRLAKKGDIYTKMSYDILNDVCPQNVVTASNKSPGKEKKKLTPKDDSLNLTRYVSGSALNFRDSPNGKKLGSFKYADKLTIYQKDGKWLRVSKYNITEKWVHEDYVSSSKPVARQSASNSNSGERRLNCVDYYTRKLNAQTQSQYNSAVRGEKRLNCNSNQSRNDAASILMEMYGK